MMNRIKIAVAGCINRDTIKHPGRPPVRGFGGTLYNIFGLSLLLGDRAEILPVCNIGHDVSRPVLNLLSRLGNVDTANVRVVPGPNNHCRMTYRNNDDRDEVFTGFVPAISQDQLMHVADCDIALINFISGRDLTLRALKRFRCSFRGVVYLDFHTLSLGLRRDGTRFLRKPRKWAEYITCCDYLQMNRNEFSLLSGRHVDDEQMLRFFRRNMLSTGMAMSVTLGGEGAAMVSARSGEAYVRRENPVAGSAVTDTTGAGDLFAAGFCAGLANRKSLAVCLELAVRAGSHGCSVLHPEDIRLRAMR